MKESEGSSMVGKPFEVHIDPGHGGRWTSLIDPRGKEWLWRRPRQPTTTGHTDPTDFHAQRDAVRPGQPFVDVGGIEECFPTIIGLPDHGDVWTRPWTTEGYRLAVRTGSFALQRTVTVGQMIVVDYELQGPAGAPFVWAFHALLEPTVGTRIMAGPTRCRTWSGPARFTQTNWPGVPDRTDADVLGPNDGTAAFHVLTDIADVTVQSADGALHFQLACDQAPTAFGVWRNLAGYPEAIGSYRSFGIEPMLGRAPGLAAADSEDLAHLPSTGILAWRLTLAHD